MQKEILLHKFSKLRHEHDPYIHKLHKVTKTCNQVTVIYESDNNYYYVNNQV